MCSLDTSDPRSDVPYIQTETSHFCGKGVSGACISKGIATPLSLIVVYDVVQREPQRAAFVVLEIVFLCV